MVASMSGPGPVNAIKRSIIDGKSVILLEGPPQVVDVTLWLHARLRS